MRNKPDIDLIIVSGITLLLIPVVIYSSSNIPRIVLGLPFVLFFPGYALVSALFPAKSRLSAVERVAYSIALSIALVALIGFLLNYVWSITLYPMLGSFSFLVLALSIAAWFRRRRLPAEEKFYLNLNIGFGWSNLSQVDKILGVCLVIVLLGAAGTSVYVFQKNKEGFTELYLLGENGKAADYPQSLLVAENGKFSLVVVNQERQTETYILKILFENGQVWVDGQAQTETTMTLAHKEKRSYEIKVAFNQPGEAQKLEFALFKDGQPEVYLNTYLKINVVQ